MIWRVLNFLFGWEYVAIHFGGGYVVRRVKMTPAGDRYVNLYGDMVFEKDNDRKTILLTVKP